MVRVDARTYPALLKAFQSIDLDNGGVNCLTPMKEVVNVPDEYAPSVRFVDAFLSKLDDEQLNKFCNGADTDIYELLGRLAVEEEWVMVGSGVMANKLLNAYFEEDWS